MAIRKTPRLTGRARDARVSASFETLENRQLLSAAAGGATHHRRHHFHSGFHATRDATHNYIITANAGSARPNASASPTGLTPATVRKAYGIDSTLFGAVKGDGTGQTIAIVDAYNDPNIASDFAAFSSAFGLPGSTLTVENQTGGTALPGVDPAAKGNTWAVETSLDVEWAHAVAPGAKILLLEANSSSLNDLFQAVDTARNTAGVSVVSMSFGGSEFSGQGSYDAHFTTPAGHAGVTFVASSGDSGAYTSGTTTPAVEYPAASPNVLAVGGTRLSVDSGGNYVSESAWGSATTSGTSGGAGGGISLYSNQPAYQKSIVTQTATKRAVPDVGFLADPASGVAVIDSYDFGSTAPWLAVGGTSLAAPMWAGVVSMVDQGRAINGQASLDGASGTLPQVYGLPTADFHDVTTGSNGYNATAGYDLVTGRGTPIVNVLAQAMAGTTPTPAPTPTPMIGSLTANPSSVTAGTTATLTASGVTETGGTISSVKFYEETNGANGLQSATDTLIGTGTQSAGGTYTINVSTTGAAAGNYIIYAVATDAAGASSAVAQTTLTVRAATTSNDLFANATPVATGTTVTGSSITATREAGEPYILNNRGGRSIWYTWTPTTTRTYTINTHGSSFDTLLGVYAGTSISALSRVASNDDDAASGTRTSSVTFTASAGTTYRITIDGFNGASGTAKLSIA